MRDDPTPRCPQCWRKWDGPQMRCEWCRVIETARAKWKRTGLPADQEAYVRLRDQASKRASYHRAETARRRHHRNAKAAAVADIRYIAHVRQPGGYVEELLGNRVIR